jgi:hypothetical protein
MMPSGNVLVMARVSAHMTSLSNETLHCRASGLGLHRTAALQVLLERQEDDMKELASAFAIIACAWLPFTRDAEASDCVVPPLSFNSHSADLESTMSVKAGKGCGFNIMGIEGAITETKITQMPKVGRAGVQGNTVYYVAKPGYKGSDEFAYAYIGTDNYGGPMRVTIKRKVDVVP